MMIQLDDIDSWKQLEKKNLQKVHLEVRKFNHII